MTLYNALLLFIWAFLESIIWPIPVATILLGIVVSDPKNWFLYGLVTTIGSALGGATAGFLGKVLRKRILEEKAFHILRKITNINPENIKKVEQEYQKYGTFAILLGALTPLPYKLFTWASGILGYDIIKLFFVSLVARGILFMSEAYILYYFGETVFQEYMSLIKQLGVVLFVLVIVYGVYWWVKHSKEFSSE